MKILIKKLKEDLKEYKNLVAVAKKHGVKNLDREQLEYYGAYLGKMELLEDIIPKLEAWK